MSLRQYSKRVPGARVLCSIAALLLGSGRSAPDIASASPAPGLVLSVQWESSPYPAPPWASPPGAMPPLPPRVYPPAYSPPATNISGAEPWPYSDPELRSQVEHALAADSLMHRTPIRVEVDQGVVTLKGAVDTWQDFYRAETDAYAAGARQVRNLLAVRHP